MTARDAIPAFISTYLAEHRYAPSMVDICARFGWTSKSTAHSHLTRLRDEGLVDWVDGQSRTFHVTQRKAEVER